MNIEDLQVPTNFREYFGTTNAIDHNLYIANAQTQGYGDIFSNSDLIYQANYRAGLRIQQVVDIDAAYDNPNHIIEVGYFDTFPNSNENKINGAWSVYPFFSSGLVAVSSVEGGLFLVKPTLNDVLISEIDVDKPTYAPTNAPTNAPTDTPDPAFENLGTGFCRDSDGTYNEDNWEVNYYCVDLPTCQEECKNQDKCLGVTWALDPSTDDNGCKSNSLPRCVVYYSEVAPVVAITKASGSPEEYTAYRYIPSSAPVDPTPAPIETPVEAPTPDPAFEDLGSGFCRDSNWIYNEDTWEVNYYCVDLPTCQEECKNQDECLGVTWASDPSTDDNGCKSNSLPRCVVYYSEVAPAVAITKASGSPEEYTAYRYIPSSAPVDSTLAPTWEPTVFDEVCGDGKFFFSQFYPYYKK